MDQIILTPESLEKIKKELKECLEKRKQIAGKIEYAKSLGDLSENFEYQEAKEDQSFNETRILELEDIMKRAVISEKNENKEVISLGSKIKIKSGDKVKNFEIVSFNEADPEKGKISNESPLGQTLLGKRVGEQAEVEAPSGKIIYEILEIN